MRKNIYQLSPICLAYASSRATLSTRVAATAYSSLYRGQAQQSRYPCDQCKLEIIQSRSQRLPRSSRCPVLASLTNIKLVDEFDQRLCCLVRSNGTSSICDILESVQSLPAMMLQMRSLKRQSHSKSHAC